MSYKNLMFIGGPLDGQARPVHCSQRVCQAVELPPQDCVALDYSSAPPNIETNVDVIQYRREWLRDFDGTIIEVMVAGGVNNPFQRLIAGYKPKHDSAGKA